MNMRRKRNKKIFRLLISIAVISSLSLSLSGCRNNMEHAKSETTVPSDIQSVQSSEDKSDSDTSPLLDSASAAPETPAVDSAKTDTQTAKTQPDTENVSLTPPLRVTGSRLTDSNGNPVQLRGISTHGLAWFPDYVNKDCFLQLKNEWSANVIRLAMYTAEYGGYCTDGDQAQLKELVKNGVQYAIEADMYVIIDWHILSDGNPNTYKEEAKAFFAEMAELYADHNNVLYEICNEPNGSTS